MGTLAKKENLSILEILDKGTSDKGDKSLAADPNKNPDLANCIRGM